MATVTVQDLQDYTKEELVEDLHDKLFLLSAIEAVGLTRADVNRKPYSEVADMIMDNLPVIEPVVNLDDEVVDLSDASDPDLRRKVEASQFYTWINTRYPNWWDRIVGKFPEPYRSKFYDFMLTISPGELIALGAVAGLGKRFFDRVFMDRDEGTLMVDDKSATSQSVRKSNPQKVTKTKVTEIVPAGTPKGQSKGGLNLVSNRREK